MQYLQGISNTILRIYHIFSNVYNLILTINLDISYGYVLLVSSLGYSTANSFYDNDNNEISLIGYFIRVILKYVLY